ncbi:MAG: hypothetical protein ACAI44_18020 [Candidatus Sericytochromatia bacterium]
MGNVQTGTPIGQATLLKPERSVSGSAQLKGQSTEADVQPAIAADAVHLQTGAVGKASVPATSAYHDKMYHLAEIEAAKATGRGLPYGIVGTVLGGVIGGAIGFYMGHNVKSAIAGASSGAILLGIGIGMQGYTTDIKHKLAAGDLRLKADIADNSTRIVNEARQKIAAEQATAEQKP